MSFDPSQRTGMPSTRLVFSPDADAVYKPAPAASPAASIHHDPTSAAAASVGGGGGSDVSVAASGTAAAHPLKRKRGRPRKYGSEGTVGLALTSQAQQPSLLPGEFSSPPTETAPETPVAVAAAPAVVSSVKKGRGRPPGSGRKQQTVSASGSTGFGFTPHVVTVKAGEDVSSKLMSISQNRTRTVCILSANGAISNVTICQAAISGGNVTYEGRFEILSLSGTFMLSESVRQWDRTAGLNILLAGPDGCVLGGGVAGPLIAACPVQVVIGSFLTEGPKKSNTGNLSAEPLLTSSPTKHITGAGTSTTAAGSPPSRGGTLSESSGGPGSPLNLPSGLGCNNIMPWK